MQSIIWIGKVGNLLVTHCPSADFANIHGLLTVLTQFLSLNSLCMTTICIVAHFNGDSIPRLVERLMVCDQSPELQLWASKWYCLWFDHDSVISCAKYLFSLSYLFQARAILECESTVNVKVPVVFWICGWFNWDIVNRSFRLLSDWVKLSILFLYEQMPLKRWV